MSYLPRINLKELLNDCFENIKTPDGLIHGSSNIRTCSTTEVLLCKAVRLARAAFKTLI
jgi:hypothetical protein